jgi:NAD(P)-dependent dehydrogenase (short-subunit alcohol dehydrogenase family)
VSLPKTPSFSLEGRRALVTGAGRGIGRAAAAALAGAGAEVVAVSRTRDELKPLVAEIEADGGRAEALVLDLADTAALQEKTAAAGPFEILVNNAGTARHAPFTEVTSEDYDLVMDLNLRAAFFTAQAVARGLIEAGRPGSIINVSSQMGHVGGEKRTVYCASKHGLEGLTKAMAVELAPHGIRVNTLGPTFVRTAMTAPFFEDPWFQETMLPRIQLGRVAEVEDLMGAIVFLASDAAAMMTGTALLVDGGWTAV